MSRKLFYALYLLVLVEISSLIGLKALQEFSNLRYEPILDQQLSLKHRLMIETLQSGEFPYVDFNAETGWSPRANQVFPLGNISYSTDDHGFRRHGVEAASTQGVQIACFGDSFTHGDEVQDNETYPAYLEQFSGIGKVYNLGIPAADPGQALSYYRSQIQTTIQDVDIVLFGSMTENIRRLVSVFRPFYLPYTGLPFVKPHYQMTEQGLLRKASYSSVQDYERLLHDTEQELTLLGKDDWFFHHAPRRRWYDVIASVRLSRLLYQHWFPPADSPIVGRQYNESSRAFQLLLAVLEQSVREVSSRGKQAMIVLFPTREDLQADVVPMYQPLRSALQRRGIDFIDVRECILKDQREQYTMPGGHYIPAVNKRVAGCIVDGLKAKGMLQQDHLRNTKLNKIHVNEEDL